MCVSLFWLLCGYCFSWHIQWWCETDDGAMGNGRQEYFWRYRCRIVFILSTIVINVVPFLFPAHISFVTEKKNTITDQPTNHIHRCCLIDIIFTICFPFIDASVLVFVCVCVMSAHHKMPIQHNIISLANNQHMCASAGACAC